MYIYHYLWQILLFFLKSTSYWLIIIYVIFINHTYCYIIYI